jgi:prepilin-type processing-associated H-X9-DG protein
MLDQEDEVDLRWLICPMDDARPDPTDKRLFWTPTPTQVNRNLPQFHWSYGAMCVGYQIPGRRVPWSGTRNGIPVGRLEGPFHFDDIPRTENMHLVWDSYFLSLNQWDGIRTVQAVMNAALGGVGYQRDWQDFYYHLFRHNRHPQPNTPEGPNALFADGHVEITTDIFALHDDNTTVPW